LRSHIDFAKANHAIDKTMTFQRRSHGYLLALKYSSALHYSPPPLPCCVDPKNLDLLCMPCHVTRSHFLGVFAEPRSISLYFFPADSFRIHQAHRVISQSSKSTVAWAAQTSIPNLECRFTVSWSMLKLTLQIDLLLPALSMALKCLVSVRTNKELVLSITSAAPFCHVSGLQGGHL
jgi:hypothetical protein